MDYCTVNDIKDRFGDKLDLWVEGNADVLPKLITLARAEIDAYLISGGYTLPLSVVPEILKVHACSITAYRLLVRIGLLGDEHDPGQAGIIAGYKQAVRWLEMVATGKLKLSVGSNTGSNKENTNNTNVSVRSYNKLDMGGFV